VFEGVRIANAPWADASRPFAVLGQAVFRFAWHRHEDRWLVTRMILRDGEVHLVRQADGRRNWRLRDPEDRGPGHFWFQALEPHRVALTFQHDAAELDLRTKATDLAAAERTDAGTLVNRVDFEMRWRGVAFAGRADTGPEITFFETGRWFPLRGQVTVPGMRIDVDGRAADLFRDLRIDAATVASGTTLTGLRSLIGARGVEPRPFRAGGALVVADAVYRFERRRRRSARPTSPAASPGRARANGRGSARRSRARAPTRPTCCGSREGVGAGDVASGTHRRGPGGRPARFGRCVRDAARDPYAAARALDADLAFQAKRFKLAAVPLLQSLKLKAKLNGGMLASPISTSAGAAAIRPAPSASTCARRRRDPRPSSRRAAFASRRSSRRATRSGA
jgi:hypothetical protein